MLTLKQVAYAIADLELLKGLDWTLVQGKRVALVGPNGAGKTTLLRVIAGELEPDLTAWTRTIGFLDQYVPVPDEPGSQQAASEILGRVEQFVAVLKDRF